jgi:hypothetical protein
MSSIYEFVKEQRESYRSQTIENRGLRVLAVSNAAHHRALSQQPLRDGNKDSLDREKPFYNITKFRVNVATRATDLDTKHVTIFSDKVAVAEEELLLNCRKRPSQ